MRKIGFIGAFDKTDFILYIAKILVEMGQKVLLVDATITQKARYIVPNIQPSKSYITQFEGIDIAVGLRNFEEIKTCLNLTNMEELPYDIALIDTNSAGGVLSYNIKDCEIIYFASSLDMYSIRRGIESLAGLQQPVEAIKIIFSKENSSEESRYIDYLALSSNINWAQEIIYMPYELGDETVIFKNQRVSKIKLRGLTNGYKDGLMIVSSQILGEHNYNQLRRVFKKIEKGV